MTFTVVHFTNDSSVEAVPSSWVVMIEMGLVCYWPPKNVRSSIAQQLLPEPSWAMYPVRKLGNKVYDELTGALEAVKRAEVMSNIDTCDDNPDEPCKLKKKKRKHNVKEMHMESDNLGKSSIFPTPPKKVKKNTWVKSVVGTDIILPTTPVLPATEDSSSTMFDCTVEGRDEDWSLGSHLNNVSQGESHMFSGLQSLTGVDTSHSSAIELPNVANFSDRNEIPLCQASTGFESEMHIDASVTESVVSTCKTVSSSTTVAVADELSCQNELSSRDFIGSRNHVEYSVKRSPAHSRHGLRNALLKKKHNFVRSKQLLTKAHERTKTPVLRPTMAVDLATTTTESRSLQHSAVVLTDTGSALLQCPFDANKRQRSSSSADSGIIAPNNNIVPDSGLSSMRLTSHHPQPGALRQAMGTTELDENLQFSNGRLTSKVVSTVRSDHYDSSISTHVQERRQEVRHGIRLDQSRALQNAEGLATVQKEVKVAKKPPSSATFAVAKGLQMFGNTESLQSVNSKASDVHSSSKPAAAGPSSVHKHCDTSESAEHQRPRSLKHGTVKQLLHAEQNASRPDDSNKICSTKSAKYLKSSSEYRQHCNTDKLHGQSSCSDTRHSLIAETPKAAKTASDQQLLLDSSSAAEDSVPDEKRFRQKVMFQLLELRHEVRALHATMRQLAQTGISSVDSDVTKVPEVDAGPVASIELFTSLDDRCRDSSTRKYIKNIGDTVKRTTKNMLNRLFTNEVMSYMSMDGKHLGKIAFRKSAVCTLVVESVLVQHTATVREVHAIIADHLKLAPYRSGGAGKGACLEDVDVTVDLNDENAEVASDMEQ